MENAEYSSIIRSSAPRLKFCERFDERSDIWNFSRHSHPYIELIYFIDGAANISVSESTLSISLYDIVVYPAQMEHQEKMRTGRHQEIICLWADIPELVLPHVIHIQDRNGRLRFLFVALHEEYKRKSPSLLLIENYTKVLLELILRDEAEQRESGRESGRLSVITQYIHSHFNEQLTLEGLAELEHISVSYLSRQFKKQTGKTVIEYINDLRCEAAKQLLMTSGRTVAEIAYLAGYESPKYFYRQFKAHAGCSPAYFRKSGK